MSDKSHYETHPSPPHSSDEEPRRDLDAPSTYREAFQPPSDSLPFPMERSALEYTAPGAPYPPPSASRPELSPFYHPAQHFEYMRAEASDAGTQTLPMSLLSYQDELATFTFEDALSQNYLPAFHSSSSESEFGLPALPPPDNVARMPPPDNVARIPTPDNVARMPPPDNAARMPPPDNAARMPPPGPQYRRTYHDSRRGGRNSAPYGGYYGSEYCHHGYNSHPSFDSSGIPVEHTMSGPPVSRVFPGRGWHSEDRKPPSTTYHDKASTKAKASMKTLVMKKSKPPKRSSKSSPSGRNSTGSSSSSSSGNPYDDDKPDADEIADARTERAQHALHSWYDRLNDLRKFKRQHGHTKVPQKYPANKELGIWVNKQRMERKAFIEGKKCSLTAKKIDKLEALGFEWAKPKGIDAWESKYKELVKYKQKYGDANVPTKYSINRALGRWVSTQRNMWKKYQAQGPAGMNLPPEEIERRIRLLDALEFTWNMVQPPADSDGSNTDGDGSREGGKGGNDQNSGT